MVDRVYGCRQPLLREEAPAAQMRACARTCAHALTHADRSTGRGAAAAARSSAALPVRSPYPSDSNESDRSCRRSASAAAAAARCSTCRRYREQARLGVPYLSRSLCTALLALGSGRSRLCAWAASSVRAPGMHAYRHARAPRAHGHVSNAACLLRVVLRRQRLHYVAAERAAHAELAKACRKGKGRNRRAPHRAHPSE